MCFPEGLEDTPLKCNLNKALVPLRYTLLYTTAALLGDQKEKKRPP